MNLTLQPISAAYVNQLWSLVEPHIAQAAVKDGSTDYTPEQIKVYLVTGQWLLVAIADEENKIHGAITISFINYPNDRVAFVTAIGGKLVSNQDTYAQLANICRANGATKIQGAARESVARLWKRFGFEEKAILVEVKLC